MDVFEAIEKRHSYRGDFTGDPVPENDLRRIVQAGIQAPSGCNAQTTSFVIVTDPRIISSISEIIEKPFVNTAKAVIACVVKHEEVYHGMAFGIEDCSAAVENILLAITALGYATVWLDGCLRVKDRAQRTAELLGVPEDREIRVLLPIGVPAEECQQKEKQPFEKRASFNRHGT